MCFLSKGLIQAGWTNTLTLYKAASFDTLPCEYVSLNSVTLTPEETYQDHAAKEGMADNFALKPSPV